jgi:hypothetical protein
MAVSKLFSLSISDLRIFLALLFSHSFKPWQSQTTVLRKVTRCVYAFRSKLNQGKAFSIKVLISPCWFYDEIYTIMTPRKTLLDQHVLRSSYAF